MFKPTAIFFALKISVRRLQEIQSLRWERRINPGCGGSIYKMPQTLWGLWPVCHPFFFPLLSVLWKEELLWKRCTVQYFHCELLPPWATLCKLLLGRLHTDCVTYFCSYTISWWSLKVRQNITCKTEHHKFTFSIHIL